MVNKIRSLFKSSKGSSLTEAIIMLSILGLLAGFALPNINKNEYINEAQQKINEINAKTLTTICQIIELESGEFASWPSNFTVLTREEAKDLIDNDIKYLGEGFFSYDSKTGIVTVSPLKMAKVKSEK